MIRYLRNPEIKHLTLKLTIFTIILMILSVGLLNIESNRLNKEYIKQNTLIVGNILSKNPELESTVIEAISMKDTSKYDLGKAILSKYSYDENLALYKNPTIEVFYNNFLFKFIFLILIFIIVVFSIVFIEFTKFYKKIEGFTKAAEEVVEGNFTKISEYNKEGEFYIFAYQFNLMVNRLKESVDKLKGERTFLKNIISDISHQLKTPLSSLIMFNELMKNEDMPKEHRNNFLNLSEVQLRRMEWLIINLLKISRLEAGVIEFNIKRNPLNITLSKALAGLLQKSKEKRQDIVIKVPESIYFKHDIEWTAEAFSNIIKNAIEHTKEGGTIAISCEETPLSLTISIKDNGEGIPKELLPKIFERFYKGENSTNPTSIGIGLSLSRSIIESQNGTIRVESELGKGTEFIITFLKTVI